MSKDLIIPIYIDTNALLDLLASIEGGFSIVEKVTTQTTGTKEISRGVKAETGTEFGIPNVLSLLKLNLGYSADWKKAEDEDQKRETERYHTYGSLFYRLREYLDSNSMIKRLDDTKDSLDTVQSSDFVELRGVFRPNPLASSLQIIDRLIGVFEIFGGLSLTPQQGGQVSKKPTPEEKKKLQQRRREAQQQIKQVAEIRKFFQGIVADLQAENIRAFVVDLDTSGSKKAVAILYMDYLRDQTMTEISYKEYRLLGKVVQVVETGSDEPIDLLLGTGLGGIGKETIVELVSSFADMPGMNLPQVETEITGPAVEVVPVAIFV